MSESSKSKKYIAVMLMLVVSVVLPVNGSDLWREVRNDDQIYTLLLNAYWEIQSRMISEDYKRQVEQVKTATPLANREQLLQEAHDNLLQRQQQFTTQSSHMVEVCQYSRSSSLRQVGSQTTPLFYYLPNGKVPDLLLLSPVKPPDQEYVARRVVLTDTIGPYGSPWARYTRLLRQAAAPGPALIEDVEDRLREKSRIELDSASIMLVRYRESNGQPYDVGVQLHHPPHPPATEEDCGDELLAKLRFLDGWWNALLTVAPPVVQADMAVANESTHVVLLVPGDSWLLPSCLRGQMRGLAVRVDADASEWRGEMKLFCSNSHEAMRASRLLAGWRQLAVSSASSKGPSWSRVLTGRLDASPVLLEENDARLTISVPIQDARQALQSSVRKPTKVALPLDGPAPRAVEAPDIRYATAARKCQQSGGDFDRVFRELCCLVQSKCARNPDLRIEDEVRAMFGGLWLWALDNGSPTLAGQHDKALHFIGGGAIQGYWDAGHAAAIVKEQLDQRDAQAAFDFDDMGATMMGARWMDLATSKNADQNRQWVKAWASGRYSLTKSLPALSFGRLASSERVRPEQIHAVRQVINAGMTVGNGR